MSAEDNGRAPIIPPSKRSSGTGRSTHSSAVAKAHAKFKVRHRLMYGALACGALATIIFLVAMATTDWIRLDFPSGVYRNSSNAYVQRHVSGLFRLCRVELNNASSPVVRREYCRMQAFFPSQQAIDSDNEIDNVFLDYARSGAAFAIIVLVLASGANGFTWYSIHQPRYMFKRVAGSLHLLTAGCILVCIEVFRNSMTTHAQSKLPGRFPTDARLLYGASFGLAWVSIAFYVAVGVALFVLSKKRKGERALSAKEAIENEPVHLGRL